jgi:hypothetical protein
MAEERIDRESGADEIVPESRSTRKDLLKIYLETAHPVSLLQQEMQRMKLRNHESVTVTLSRLLTKIRCVTGRTTRMQSKSLRKSGKRLCGDLCQKGITKSQGMTTTFSYPGPILTSDGSEDESSTPRRRISRIKAVPKCLRGIHQFWPEFPRTQDHDAMSAATTGGSGSA